MLRDGRSSRRTFLGWEPAAGNSELTIVREAATHWTPVAHPLSFVSFISPSVFWRPDQVTSSPWVEHIPFAFWLVPALKPGVLVELGAPASVSYCAFCQAIQACGIDAKASAVEISARQANADSRKDDDLNKIIRHHDAKYSHFSRMICALPDEAARSFEDGSIDLLHIDKPPDANCLTYDLQTWLPKLSSRAVVLLHNINAPEGGSGVSELWSKWVRAYPGFEFHHGNGLGVLGVGRELPESIVRLMAVGNDTALQAEIRQAFSALGQGISARYFLERRTSDCERFSKAIARLEAAMARLEQALESAIEGFSRSILQDIARLRSWDASASWKFGSVISKLSRLGKERTSWVWRPRLLADQMSEMIQHAQQARSLNEHDEQTSIQEFIRIHDSVKEQLRSLERAAPLEFLGPLRAMAKLRSHLVRPATARGRPSRQLEESGDSKSGPPRWAISESEGGPGRPESPKASFAIYYSRSGHYFFREISILLHAGLKGMGFHSELRTEADGRSEQADIHIVVGPHEFFFLDIGSSMFAGRQAENLVLINTEQPGNHWFRLAASVFPQARHIFDPNHGGAEFIRQLGFSASHLPPAFVENLSLFNAVGPLPKVQDTESLSDEVCQWLDADLPLRERPIDVSFVGQANPRRSSFFAKAAARFEKFECHLRLISEAGPWTSDPRDRDLRTRITTGLSRRSKIVLNVHREESPYFEWHRVILMGVWQKALVISETVNDSQPLIPGVDFIQAPLDDIPEAIEYYLRDPAGIQEAEKIRAAGFMKLKTQCSLQSLLESAWRPLIDALIVSGKSKNSA
jgi:hypothetical protein